MIANYLLKYVGETFSLKYFAETPAMAEWEMKTLTDKLQETGHSRTQCQTYSLVPEQEMHDDCKLTLLDSFPHMLGLNTD